MVAVPLGDAKEDGYHRDRQWLREVFEQVSAPVGGDRAGQLVDHVLGELRDRRPQALHMAAVEGAGDHAAQAGVRRRLVLKQGVPVQEVERREPLGGLSVGPDAAEPAVPEYG
jgi:hypothetical protein